MIPENDIANSMALLEKFYLDNKPTKTCVGCISLGEEDCPRFEIYKTKPFKERTKEELEGMACPRWVDGTIIKTRKEKIRQASVIPTRRSIDF